MELCLRLAIRLLVGTVLHRGQTGFAAPATPGSPAMPQGAYFARKAYQAAPLPDFARTRDLLPSPIFAERPEWVAMYWKAWELAFKNFHEPAPGSGYVSQFIDAAFNQNIFQWDTCFMALFGMYAPGLFPAMESLDNFYNKQRSNGFISRPRAGG